MDLILYFEFFWVSVSQCYFAICLAVLASGYAAAPFHVYLQHRNALREKVKVRLFERCRLDLWSFFFIFGLEFTSCI